MRNKDLAGKEALRIEVFMPELNPDDERRAKKFVGTQFDLSLILRNNGVHHAPGGLTSTRVCYELYMHDEVTPGGLLIADSCQLPEYYLDQAAVDTDTEVITLTMNNGHVFTLDLHPIMQKYDTMIRRDPGGKMVFTKGGIDRIDWIEGATYSYDDATDTLIIHAPDGNDYIIHTPAWDFLYDGDNGTLTIMKDGEVYATIPVGNALGVYPSATVQYVAGTGGASDAYHVHHYNSGLPDLDIYPTIATQLDDTKVGVTVTNPDGTQVSFVVQGGDNVIILNNPVIYLRQDTGSASPPINKQSDLTVANAFNSFTAIQTFLQNAIIVGTVTINARGTFNDISLTGSNMKTSTVVINGDPANPDNLIFEGRAASGVRLSNVALTLRYANLRLFDEVVSPYVASVISVNAGAQLNLLENIKFSGNYNIDRVNAGNASFIAATADSVVGFGSDLRLILSVNGAMKITSLFRAGGGGIINIGTGLTVTITNSFFASTGWFRIGAMSAVNAAFTGAASDLPSITGTFKADVGALWLGYVGQARWNGWAENPFTTFDWHVRDSTTNAVLHGTGLEGAILNDLKYTP